MQKALFTWQQYSQGGKNYTGAAHIRPVTFSTLVSTGHLHHTTPNWLSHFPCEVTISFYTNRACKGHKLSVYVSLLSICAFVYCREGMTPKQTQMVTYQAGLYASALNQGKSCPHGSITLRLNPLPEQGQFQPRLSDLQRVNAARKSSSVKRVNHFLHRPNPASNLEI